MRGYKFLQELLRINSSVKVVIISGHVANGRGKDAGSFEIAGFIGQSYQLKELAATVRCMLDEKKMKLNLNESSPSSLPFLPPRKALDHHEGPAEDGRMLPVLEGGRGGK